MVSHPAAATMTRQARTSKTLADIGSREEPRVGVATSWASGRIEHPAQIGSVAAVVEGGGEALELCAIYVSGAIGNLFRAGDLESLALLDDLDEGGGFQQGVVRARVEPGHAASHELGMELAALKVEAV